jgi:antitoxin ParD1/3/4
MGQTTLNVTLPEELETYLKERVREGSYDSPGDYIGALIREDRERRARATLDRLLLEGLESEPDLVTRNISASCVARRRSASSAGARGHEIFGLANARGLGKTSSNWSRASRWRIQRQRLLCMTPTSACWQPRSQARRISAGPMPPATLVFKACG